MPLSLVIHNTGYIISIVASLPLAIFVLFRGPNKLPNILFFLLVFTWVIYAFTYLVAVNVSDPILSHEFSVWNMITLFSVAFNCHLAFAAFGEDKKHTKFIVFSYVFATALVVYFLGDTYRYHVTPVPQAEFPLFMKPGKYYFLCEYYFYIVFGYFTYQLILLYRKSGIADRNRIKYFVISFILAYGVTLIGFNNVNGDTSIDEVWTIFVGFFVFPLAYGVFKYNVVDVSVAARKFLVYFFYIACFAFIMTALNIINNELLLHYNNFPIWLLPLIVGIALFGAGMLVLKKLRETDDLKYEFINNISHKFRTPLTHIRSVAEELRGELSSEEKGNLIDRIQYESIRLFELTNIVINTSGPVNDAYQYQFEPIDLTEVVKEIGKVHKTESDSKNLNVVFNIDTGAPKVRADRTRILFALQILFENAIAYTPVGGTIEVTVVREKNGTSVMVKDSGIGISPIDLPHVFSKFYRSQSARSTDTEGLGVGLFMAKSIVEKHLGTIGASSEGENKGATITVTLPAIAALA